jgi:uncharacterized protein YqgV (UPF0045/DUF77 family)
LLGTRRPGRSRKDVVNVSIPPSSSEERIMRVSAQISLYPLRQEKLGPSIDALLGAFEEADLQVEVGAMSTLVVGEAGPVFRAVEKGFGHAAQRGPVALVVTISNACPAIER